MAAHDSRHTPIAMTNLTDEQETVLYARRQWEEGEDRLQRHTPDSERRQTYEDIIAAISVELERRIGQSFDGLITTVVEFGCFVQLLEIGIDGLLHTQNLRDDDYEMERDGHGWIGRRTRRRLRTGAHIRVMVTAVNPIEGLIDLELLDDEA